MSRRRLGAAAHRLRGRWWGLGAAIALTSALAPGLAAQGAPYVGEGAAAIAGDGDRVGPRQQALLRARAAALAAALAEVDGGGAEARAQLLAKPAVWTAAYRVLRQGDDGATITVEVEVEIDTLRLEKLLAGDPAGAARGTSTPVLGALDGVGCAPEIVDGARSMVVARGLARAAEGGGAPGTSGGLVILRLALHCEALGSVPLVRQVGARVRVAAELTGVPGVPGASGGPLTRDGVAFAGDPEAAALEALRHALIDLGGALYQAQERSLAVELAAPWPAVRVRRLERAIRLSVVGVRGVAVAGITAQGAVILRVDGAEELSAELLAQRLGALEIPGAPLRVVGVTGPRRVAATFKKITELAPAE